MRKRITWLACATLLCALLIALPAAQTALASSTDVAKIGDTTYASLQDAVKAVPTSGTKPTTITLLRDAAGNGVVVENGQCITFDLADHTYDIDGTTVGSSGTETNGFQLQKGSAVTFKNGTITSDKAKILIQNYSNLTLENVVLDGRNLDDARPYTLSLNNGNVNITGNTSILAKANGGVAFDLYYWPKNGYSGGVQVTVNTTGTISGPIELSQDGTGADEAAKHNKLTIQNINHEGTISNYNVGTYDNSIVKIKGGTFAYAPTKYTGDTVVSTGGDYYVGKQANDVLNANGVITAINANGFKSWGNNTAAYPSATDPKDRWWAVRRFFDWDGNNFIQTYFQKVDKPGNKRLIQSIVDSQNIIGNGYVARDYCAGYRVEFRSDENPVTNLLAGHLTVHTYLAPYIPAEYIENIREYDVDALESAIGGE